MTPSTAPLLSVENLTVRSGGRHLVKDIGFEIFPGQRVGLIGESGSGKSLTCLSIIGLLSHGLHATGRITLHEGSSPAQRASAEPRTVDLLGASQNRMSTIRGNRLSMVFQEPMTALNPLMKVGRQVAEVIRLHRPKTEDAYSEVLRLLDSVRIPDPARAASVYPHQMSGGQRQRVMLAIAMANSPDLLLADEPTTALDVTVQRQILNLMGEQVQTAGSSMLFITHDLSVVSEVCDRVIIMRDGQILETGSIERVFSSPQHPYTRALLAASALEEDPGTGRLLTVETMRGSAAMPEKKDQADAAQASLRPEAEAGPSTSPSADIDHQVAVADGTLQVFNETPSPAISVRDLTRTYGKPGLFGRGRTVEALRGVSFDIATGQRFGIVGESGSGKSTLLRLITALDEPTSGEVTIAGEPIGGRPERRLRWLRESMQIVFQDPMGSLDPRMKVREIIAEPLHRTGRIERHDRVHELLDQVGLPASSAEKYPHEFSGGQRQRIAIARALVTRPKILVADEAVSALDVSVRAQVLNLLDDLVDEYNLTMVFVSHDLNVVRYNCNVVAVMQDGRIVECGPAETVFKEPGHDYTAELIAAIPRLAERAA